MKKLLSVLLALTLCLSLLPPVFAAGDEAVEAAEALYALGLFKGTGTDENGKPIFELDRTPQRTEGVTMLVRLLGADEVAQDGDWEVPFTDVPDWALPYVGYAYEAGLTKGTGDTTFGSTLEVNAAQYLTFVLRALGYEDGEDKDFLWNSPWTLTDELGITHGEYNAETAVFTRGDVAILSYRALSAKVKDSELTLRDTMTLSGYVGYVTALLSIVDVMDDLADAAEKEDVLATMSGIGTLERLYDASVEQLDRVILFGADREEICAAARALRDHWTDLPERNNSLDQFLVWFEAFCNEDFLNQTAVLLQALDNAFINTFPELAADSQLPGAEDLP